MCLLQNLGYNVDSTSSSVVWPMNISVKNTEERTK